MNYTIVWNDNKTEGIITTIDTVSNVGKSGYFESHIQCDTCNIISLSEPTQEMIDAGYEELCSSSEQSVERIYKAMIQKINLQSVKR